MVIETVVHLCYKTHCVYVSENTSTGVIQGYKYDDYSIQFEWFKPEEWEAVEEWMIQSLPGERYAVSFDSDCDE